MKQASIPVYIRFGEIPKDGKSKIHWSDEIAGIEPRSISMGSCKSKWLLLSKAS